MGFVFYLLCKECLGAGENYFPAVVTKSTDGDIIVTVNNMVLNPADGQDIKLDNLGVPTGPILVRGLHMGLDIDPSTLNLFNYTLTGRCIIPLSTTEFNEL